MRSPSSFRFAAYTPADAPAWNAFVAASRNATFLFDRGYMDYHAQRFADASLLVYETRAPGGERLVALLPANREGDVLASHAGLTYGGLLLGESAGAQMVLHLMRALQAHLHAQGVRELHYKAIPAPYHRRPCQEDLYALWRCGAELLRRDAVAAIAPLARDWPAAARKRVTGAVRRQPGLVIADEPAGGDGPAWGEYWALLQAQLAGRHGAAPTHSEAEMRLLATRFPTRIRLKTARIHGDMVAGTVLYDCATARHAQYSAMRAGSGDVLWLVFEAAIAEAQAGQRWFDFGNSNERQGRWLNAGLAFFKQSLGASTVVQDFYRLPCRPARSDEDD